MSFIKSQSVELYSTQYPSVVSVCRIRCRFRAARATTARVSLETRRALLLCGISGASSRIGGHDARQVSPDAGAAQTEQSRRVARSREALRKLVDLILL